MLSAIKVRLYPSEEQQVYISNLVGCCRFVYNSCLSYKIENYEKTKQNVNFGQLGQRLTWLKTQKEYEWLKNVHSKVLQQSLINLETAYKNFFKNGTGFPNFKSKKDKQSCRFPSDAISGIRGNRINLIKKLSNVHFKCSRRDEIILNEKQDEIKSATLNVTKSGKYYLSILIDIESSKKLPDSTNQIGIDVGIKDFVIASNGDVYPNLKIKRNNERKLKKLHRNLSRKKKGGQNRNKARKKLARFYEKLNHKKEYYLHEVANKLLEENQLIAIEDLNVSGMLKNRCLAKSIQELSLFRFKEILLYKANWYGRTLIQIGTFFPSSKLCGHCGHKNKELELKDREWTCPNCGIHHDRDLNAAQNILKEGIRISKLGLSSPEVTLGEIGSLEQSLNQEQNVIS